KRCGVMCWPTQSSSAPTKKVIGSHGARQDGALFPQESSSTAFPLVNSALGIGGGRAHNSPMGKLHYERADYSVVVKNRAPPPKPRASETCRSDKNDPEPTSASASPP